MGVWDISERGSWDDAIAMVGKDVKVTLSREPESTVEGQLLLLCDDGSFRVRDETGMINHCWPALRIEVVGA